MKQCASTECLLYREEPCEAAEGCPGYEEPDVCNECFGAANNDCGDCTKRESE